MQQIWVMRLQRYGGANSASVSLEGAFDDYISLLRRVVVELRKQGEQLPAGNLKEAIAKFFKIDVSELDSEKRWLHCGARNSHAHPTHNLCIERLLFGQLAEVVG